MQAASREDAMSTWRQIGVKFLQARECQRLTQIPEMYKYLDDKISGWTTAGYFTGQVLLLPVYILVLLVAR